MRNRRRWQPSGRPDRGSRGSRPDCDTPLDARRRPPPAPARPALGRSRPTWPPPPTTRSKADASPREPPAQLDPQKPSPYRLGDGNARESVPPARRAISRVQQTPNREQRSPTPSASPSTCPTSFPPDVSALARWELV